MTHRLRVVWDDRLTVPRVVVKCPCGWHGTPRAPELKDTMSATLAEYKAHLG